MTCFACNHFLSVLLPRNAINSFALFRRRTPHINSSYKQDESMPTIYTRNGDDGQTSLFSGDTVTKHSLRVQAYGTIDELNSLLGCAVAITEAEREGRANGEMEQTQNKRSLQELQSQIQDIQGQLMQLGSDLATPTGTPKESRIRRISGEHITQIEQMIDELDTQLPALQSFILPGGSRLAATLHVARTVCRRAERNVSELIHTEGEKTNTETMAYLNRLSDALFVMARYANKILERQDVKWTDNQ